MCLRITFVCLLLLAGMSAAQQMTRLEYYLDTDPGRGNGAQIAIRSSAVVDTSFSVNLNGVTPGMHRLVIRGCDNTGIWTLPLVKLILVERLATPLVTRYAEYYLDTDPGKGNGIPIAIRSTAVVDTSFIVNLNGITPGMHRLVVRSCDNNGIWTLPLVKLILVESVVTPIEIRYAEYFLDTDPGRGNGTPITIISNDTVQVTFTTNLTGVSSGFHYLYLRVQDASGMWSIPNRFSLMVERIQATPLMARIEYFFDTDPGRGNGSSIPMNVATIVDTSFVANLTNLTSGFHRMYVRTQDNSGMWSLPFTNLIYVEYLPANPLIAGAEYYLDTDPGRGNGTVIPIGNGTSADTSFVVNVSTLNPGIHTLFIRTRDNGGKWSLPLLKTILVERLPAIPLITAGEYYIGNDPGRGNGIPIALTPAGTVDTNFVVSLSAYPIGSYSLYMRFRDNAGKWSLPLLHRLGIFEPPSEPRVLLVSYTANNAVLNWTAPATGTIAGYRIYRHSTTGHFTPPASGTFIGTVNGTTTTYTDNNVTGQYFYRVIAYDSNSSE